MKKEGDCENNRCCQYLGPTDASSNLRAKTNPVFSSYFFKVPVAVLKSFRKNVTGKYQTAWLRGEGGGCGWIFKTY